MGSLLNSLRKGVVAGATTAKEIYQDDAKSQRQAKIMAARDKELRANQVEDREDKQSYDAEQNALERTARNSRPSEKLAEVQLEDLQAYRKATSPEEQLEAAKKIMAASGRPMEGDTKLGKRFIGGSKGVFDTETQEWIDPPQDRTSLVKEAGKIARDIDANQVDMRGNRLPDAKSYDVILKDILSSWEKNIGGKPAATGGNGDKVGGSDPLGLFN